MSDKLTYSNFKTHLNETFSLTPDSSEPLQTELVEVSHMGPEPSSDENRRRAFSLIFLGPEDPVLEQGTYLLEHKNMGRLDLFLVPIGPGKHGFKYEAVFN